jgi:hypothetical protein
MFLKAYAIEPSTEKRARAEGLPWTPHIVLGGRVYYSKTLVNTWFEQQAAVKLGQNLGSSGHSASVTAETETSTEVTAQ